MSFWKSLESKGKYATVIGFILGLGSSVAMLIMLFKNKDFGYIPFIVAFLAAIGFFILPSKFKFKWKDVEIEVED